MLAVLVSVLLSLHAVFSPPVHGDIVLAGNFGEPRPNHFHGGIDIKTGGVEGKPVFSIGDGYVSHVTVGLYGFGNAVYVHHPEGITSIYCHLRSFTPQMKAMVRKWQYDHHKSTGKITFRPTDFPVAKGQLIAVSGNTGSSQAPHLHLEIHDTHTWDMLDPLEYLGDDVADGLPPLAHRMMACPVEGEGLFCGSSQKQTFAPNGSQPSVLTAWGHVGFAIWADDYMEAAYNHYGIRKTELYVDGRLIFQSDVDRIAPSHNMQVNAWGDYDHYCKTHQWYMRSFLLPGMTLPILQADSLHGIVDFHEQRDYHLVYVLKDYKGNTSRYPFTVRGERMAVHPKPPRNPLYMLYEERTNYYQLPGMQLIVRKGLLPSDICLQPHIVRQPGHISDTYQLMPTSYPLFDYAPLSIRINSDMADTEKLYIVSHSDKDRYVGGHFQDGWVTARVRDLGAIYEVLSDTTPPLIEPIGEGSWESSHILRMSLTDEESGMATYEAYIDQQFILFEEVPHATWLRCDLRETPVRPTGRSRTLTVMAADRLHNKRIYTTRIRY